MDTMVAEEMLRMIKAEHDRRVEHLPEEDGYDQWIFIDEPFVNELCLTLLVAIRHQVERELVLIAARVTNGGRELEGEQYTQRIQKERDNLKKHDGWKDIAAKLHLGTFHEWGASMETLRLLANSYKHDPWAVPDEKLLKHLGLSLEVTYKTLSESDDLKKGLAASLNLQSDADYCDISDELLTRAGRFITEVKKTLKEQGILSSIKPRLVSHSDFAY